MIELDSHLNDQVKNETKHICIWHNGFMREYSNSNMVYLYVQKEMYLYTVYIYVYIHIYKCMLSKQCASACGHLRKHYHFKHPGVSPCVLTSSSVDVS